MTPRKSLPDVHAQDAVKRLKDAGGWEDMTLNKLAGTSVQRRTTHRTPATCCESAEDRGEDEGLRTKLFKIHVSSLYILK